MNSAQFFHENPVFRHEAFVAWKVTSGGIQASSANSALHYYVQKGRVKRIRRKLYAVVPPNETAESLVVDPYLVAGKATEDAVLGYHTALEIMGMAYSSFGQHAYLTAQKSKLFEFQGQLFQPTLPPTALLAKQKAMFFVDTINRQGVSLKVTNPARTFVDVLDRVALCGGWEEVHRALTRFQVLRIEDVIDYALLLENARLCATVGYFLSERNGIFAVSEGQLEPLLKASPKAPQLASKKTQETYELIKPGNILMPASVIHHSWEDPGDNF